MRTLIQNVRIVGREGITEGECVLVEKGTILYRGPWIHTSEQTECLDGKGMYLSAGFIDTHIHGGNGCDFMDGTQEAFRTIAEYHAGHGITSMLATTLAGEEEETAKVLETFCRTATDITACHLLGVHMEGPYFAMSQRGAQDAAYITAPNRRQYERFLSYGCIKRWSSAPELPGSLAFGRLLRDKRIVASAAHTEADYAVMQIAAENGYSLMTHLYSGMLGVHRKGAERYGGAVEACLLMETIDAEIIADGCHLPSCLLKLVYQCKGREGILLTSDAMRGAGMQEGAMTVLGSLTKGQPVIIENGVAKLPDKTSFAGSIASGDRLVRTMWKEAQIPLQEVIPMITENPAAKIGIQDTKGRIQAGYDADMVLFDEEVRIQMVMTGGRILPVGNLYGFGKKEPEGGAV